MNVKLLFNLVLKILGLLFIKDLVGALPNLLFVFFELFRGEFVDALLTLIMSLITIGIYGIVIYFLLFKTEYLMQRFKLADSISSEEIPLNIHRSTVVSIALMIVALLLITQAIPFLLRGVFNWYMYQQQTKGLLNRIDPFDYSMLVVYASQILVGLILIGNLRTIVGFIELKQRKTGR